MIAATSSAATCAAYARRPLRACEDCRAAFAWCVAGDRWCRVCLTVRVLLSLEEWGVPVSTAKLHTVVQFGALSEVWVLDVYEARRRIFCAKGWLDDVVR